MKQGDSVTVTHEWCDAVDIPEGPSYPSRKLCKNKTGEIMACGENWANVKFDHDWWQIDPKYLRPVLSEHRKEQIRVAREAFVFALCRNHGTSENDKPIFRDFLAQLDRMEGK